MCRVGIFNKDDGHFEDMTKDCQCEVYTYSINNPSDLQASDIELYKGQGTLGVEFQTHGMLNATFHTNIPGRFSVYNSLVAIMVCHLVDIEETYIQTALKQVRVRGRVEIVPTPNDYTVLIDYAHNALSFQSILETISEYKPHHMICVYGAGGHRDHKRRYEAGEIVAKFNAFSVLTADNPRGEKIKDICDYIIEGVNRYNGDYIVIEDREEAIHYALSHAQSGDVILCLGKGHEDYQILDKEPLPFSEKEIIENYFR